MFNAEISTGTIGNGTNESPYGPQMKDYMLSWSDATGIPVPNFTPNPNAMNVFITCEDLVMEEINNDSDFFVHWSELIVEEEPV